MGKTLLVVEDDPDIQDYLSIVLSPLGLDIVRAANGREALDLIDGGLEPDLILLDVIMPVMDGEAFFRVLRQERHSPLRVILASVDDAIAKRIVGLGEVQGIFRKGGSGRELKDLIRGVLESGG